MISWLKRIVQHAIDCKHPEWVIEMQKQQERFFRDCILRNIGSWLYDCGISFEIEKILSVRGICKQIWLFDYAKLKPYIDSETLTAEKPLYMGHTSGTSDGNKGGKDVPITKLSLENGEQKAMKNTLCSVVFDFGWRFLVKGRALTLSGWFDGKGWYISGIIKHHSGYFGDLLTYPSKVILAESDRTKKKQYILADLRDNEVKITSIHGVPTWPLELLQYIIKEDIDLARKVFADIAYISIGWWPALDYKKRYKNLFESIGITQEIAFTNNHNATEWFYGSQQRNFTDLDFHWMRPHIRWNWFAYIPLSCFDTMTLWHYDTKILWNIIWIHEVVPGVEYVQIVVNDRIPVPYIVKDIVEFNNDWEYIVTWRIGMASNVANEHIEQKHILECLSDLHAKYPECSDFFAIAGMELTESNTLIFHRIIELKDVEMWYAKSLNLPQSHNLPESHIIEDFIHSWFKEHHEQYAGFVIKWKIIWVRARMVWPGQIKQYLQKSGRWHEQSKIPHIGNENYGNIIAGWYNEMAK